METETVNAGAMHEVSLHNFHFSDQKYGKYKKVEFFPKTYLQNISTYTFTVSYIQVNMSRYSCVQIRGPRGYLGRIFLPATSQLNLYKKGLGAVLDTFRVGYPAKYSSREDTGTRSVRKLNQ